MKVRIAVQTIVGLLAASWASAQAPYPPSGYRPEGRQFTLPRRPQDNQGFGSGLRPQTRYGAPPNPPPNQYGAPQNPPPNQYGAPDNRPQATQAPPSPPDQYLLGDVRFNFGEQSSSSQEDQYQQDIAIQSRQQGGWNPQGQQQFGYAGQNGLGQQYDFSNQNQNQQQPQQEYGVPDQSRFQAASNQQQLNQNRQQFYQQQSNQNQQQLYQQQRSYFSQSKNFEQKSFIEQGFSDTRPGLETANVNQQRKPQKPLPRTSASGRSYLAPREDNVQQSAAGTGYLAPREDNVQQNAAGRGYLAPREDNIQQSAAGRGYLAPREDNVQQTAAGRSYLAPREDNVQQQNRNVPQPNRNVQNQRAKQLYDAPRRQEDEEFVRSQNDEQESTEDDSSRQNFGIASENYLPPSTTERRRYPEPTTGRPETGESDEPERAQDPNVAIATAIAKGQYYLWQPDGSLQRVLYKTIQTEADMKNNAYTAKLVYQNVEPITAPIYAYNAPLVTVS